MQMYSLKISSIRQLTELERAALRAQREAIVSDAPRLPPTASQTDNVFSGEFFDSVLAVYELREQESTGDVRFRKVVAPFHLDLRPGDEVIFVGTTATSYQDSEGATDAMAYMSVAEDIKQFEWPRPVSRDD
jgi:hypothetical protein